MDVSDSKNSFSLTSEQAKTILAQINNSICIIKKEENSEDSWFFCLIPDSDSTKLQPVLITCNSIFGINDLKKGKYNITLFHNNKEKVITIDESRYIYSSEAYDITIIELKKDEFPENVFLILDDSINDIDKEEINKTKNQIQEIYVIYYLNGKEPKYLIDKIKDINDSIIKDYCSNENIPTGSPILNLNTFNVIGIHQGKDKNTKYNAFAIIKIPINEYNKSKTIAKKKILD